MKDKTLLIYIPVIRRRILEIIMSEGVRKEGGVRMISFV